MSRKHIHKYEKVNIGSKKDYYVYLCRLPNCNHRLIPQSILNKSSICWGCEKDFLVTKQHLDVNKLKCDRCRGKEVLPDPEPVAVTFEKGAPSSMDLLLKKLGVK